MLYEVITDAEVDQAGLLAPADDLDRAAQRALHFPEKRAGMAHAPEGLGAYGPDVGPGDAAQPLPEARQAIQRTRARRLVELAVSYNFV